MIDAQARAQIQEFLLVLRRRRWQILLPALFVLTIGSAFAAIVPKKYVVETEIEIKPSRIPQDYQFRNPQQSAAAREVENAEQHIKNYNRIKRIIEQQGDLWPEYQRAGEAVQQELILSIRDNLEVEVGAKKNNQGSTFVTITYRDPDKGRAARFLNDLREAWLEDVVAWDLSVLKSERDSLQKQKAQAEERNQVLYARFYELCRELELDPLVLLSRQQAPRGPENDYYYGLLQGQITARDETLAELERVRGELETTTLLFENEPEQTVEIRSDPGVSFAAEIREARSAIQKIRAQMDRMTPANSRYRVLEREAAQLEQTVRELEARERGGGTVEVPVPNPRKLEYAEERDRLLAQIRGLEEQVRFHEDQIERLRNEVAARTRKYEDLARVQNELRLSSEDLDQVQRELSAKERAVRLLREGAGRPYEIATPALAETAPQEPNPALIVAFAGALGLAMGLFLALIVEYGRNSYRTAAELASVLSVPVLGAIEPIVTRSELRRTQFRRAMVGFSTAVLIGGIAWITYMYKLAPEKLPVEIQQALDSLELILR